VGLHLPVVTLTGGIEGVIIAATLIAGLSATRWLGRRWRASRCREVQTEAVRA
jgi:hypothetical protein